MTDPLAVLQRIRQSEPRALPRAGEVCELCTEPIADGHGHLVDLHARTLLCACRGCYLLFDSEGAGGEHFRSVPHRYRAFPDFALSAAQWEALQIPVSVAFFFLNSSLGRVAAFYPGPAGATESELPLDTWAEVTEANPELRHLEADVEAFLVRTRPDQGGPECYIVPIDACYELVGHLRRLWRGFDGGKEANAQLDTFFDDVRAKDAVTALSFEVLSSRAEPHAAVPTIMLRLRVEEADGFSVHALALRCQIRIEPQRRRYSLDEESRLYEMFGQTPQWGESLRPFLWTHVSTTIGKFDGSTEFDLPVECTYDFEVAGAKYLHALADGDIPLNLLFSGTVFTRGGAGFSAEPLSWSLEASHKMPVAVWRAMMDLYYPNSGWIRVRRDTLDDLQRFRAVRGLPTWDQALEQLLKQAGEEGR